MFQTITTLLFVLAVSTVEASLYTCSKGNGRPHKTSEQEIKFSFEYTPALFPEIAKASFKNMESKIPFLVYYAVDSTEAFMQYTVRFEIASLIEKCKESSNVNFVGFINSLYVEKNQFVACREKNFYYINISEFPELDKKLKMKRKLIISGYKDEIDGPLSYRSPYENESNKAFGRYPLAHPDFLYDLVHFTMNHQNFFPSKTYVPFFNLKSHGGKYNVLAGMHECQEEAKKLSTFEIIEKILSKEEIKFLKQQNSYEKVQTNLVTYEKILSKIGIGNSIGFEINTDLGMKTDRGLGIYKSGLGNALSGLGGDQGLGGELAFGTGQLQLGWVLDDLFANDSDITLGFLMLESCETNRGADLFHSYLNNIYGYYSAKETLWYRNLNWWEMLEEANGSSTRLIEIIKVKTSEILNIQVRSGN